MSRITTEQRIQEAYQRGIRIGVEQANNSQEAQIRQVKRDTIHAAVQLLQESSKMMSRAGYLLDKLKDYR